MKEGTNLLERIVKFFTGKTPGLAKKNDVVCKHASEKIDAGAKERHKASVKFQQAQGALKDSIIENVELTQTAFARPHKA